MLQAEECGRQHEEMLKVAKYKLSFFGEKFKTKPPQDCFESSCGTNKRVPKNVTARLVSRYASSDTATREVGPLRHLKGQHLKTKLKDRRLLPLVCSQQAPRDDTSAHQHFSRSTTNSPVMHAFKTPPFTDLHTINKGRLSLRSEPCVARCFLHVGAIMAT